MPEISVILPIYNVEPYLEKCITSLLGQTFTDLEIIAVNDGSTDNSLAILQRYGVRDRRLKVFNQENRGIGITRGWALSKAKGKYIMFCDSDDSYEPTMCERMKETLENTQSDMVMCDCEIKAEDHHGRDDGYMEYLRLQFKGEMRLDVQKRLDVNCLLWNKIFKNSLIQKYHITFPPVREHDDASFAAQYLSVCNKIYGLDEKLYHYLLRRESLMGTFFNNPAKADRWARLYAWKHTVDFLIQNGKWPEYKEVFVRLFFACLDWLQQNFKWEHFSKEDLQKMRTYVSGVPLAEGQSDLENKLYALQQGKEGFPDTIRSCHTRYIGGFLPLKTKMSWRGKSIRFCGVEVYKERFAPPTKRWLGIFTSSSKTKSCIGK